LVPCPLQKDPKLYQLTDCMRITDKTTEDFRNFIMDLSTITGPNKIKFLMDKIEYYDKEESLNHMNLKTGDYARFHKYGKFWSFKKYPFFRFSISKIFKISLYKKKMRYPHHG
jgi:hypothetical protein